MSLRDLQEYTDALGFSPQPQGRSALKPTSTGTAPSLDVLFISHEADTPESLQLLNKMIEAMGSPSNKVIAASDTALLGSVPAKCVVNLGKTRAAMSDAPVKTLATYHPALCLQKAELKKPVWEDLQAVIKELKRS